MTEAQARVMAAAGAHGFIAQRRISATSCTPDMFAGVDGRARDVGPFNWSTVDALVRSGHLAWISRRSGRCGRWVAALARVEG